MELNFSFVSLFVFTQFLISFPIGFLLFGEKIKSIPFVIKLPIYISLGMIIINVILFAIGVVWVNQYLLIAIAIISYFLLFYKLFKKRYEFHLNFSVNWLQKHYVSIISIVFFILVFFHFAFVTGYMGWPPAGDITNHGMITSLIQHNEKLGGTLSPLWPEVSVRAPLGLHLLASNYSSLFGIFPGESFFAMGTSIIILIMWTVFSTVYILTRSLAFSLIALSATFYIHPSLNLTRWLVGYFYNGPYPNMYGYLILIIFIVFWFILPNNERRDKKFVVMIFSTMLGFLIVYPPFVILPALFIIIELIIKYFKKRNLNENKSDFKHSPEHKKNFLKRYQLSWVAIVTPVIMFDILILNQLDEIIQAVQRANIQYMMSFEEYFVDYTYILVMLTLLFSCIFILKRKYLRLSIFYLVFTSILVFSTQEIVFEQIWFLFSGRLFSFLHIFSWIMILLYSREMIRWKFDKHTTISSYISNRNLSRIIIGTSSIVLISILFLGPLISHATLEQAEKWGWFPTSKSFQKNYDFLAWISNNIKYEDLMMTDYSYTSKFIQSFSIQNVTASTWPTSSDLDIARAKESQFTWENPQNFPNYLQKYDIKYVLINSEWGYKNNLLIGNDSEYLSKDYNMKQYRGIFLKFAFLEPVKETDTAIIYKVLKPELNEFLSKYGELYDFSKGKDWKIDEISDDFSFLLYDDDHFSLISTNASNAPAYLTYEFSDIKNSFSLKDAKWINVSVNATHPTTLTIILQEPSKDSFEYLVRIDDIKLITNKIENITVPITLKSSIKGTPQLSQIESLIIMIKPLTDDNHITFHKLSFTG